MASIAPQRRPPPHHPLLASAPIRLFPFRKPPLPSRHTQRPKLPALRCHTTRPGSSPYLRCGVVLRIARRPLPRGDKPGREAPRSYVSWGRRAPDRPQRYTRRFSMMLMHCAPAPGSYGECLWWRGRGVERRGRGRRRFQGGRHDGGGRRGGVGRRGRGERRLAPCAPPKPRQLDPVRPRVVTTLVADYGILSWGRMEEGGRWMVEDGGGRAKDHRGQRAQGTRRGDAVCVNTTDAGGKHNNQPWDR